MVHKRKLPSPWWGGSVGQPCQGLDCWEGSRVGRERLLLTLNSPGSFSCPAPARYACGRISVLPTL